jgi:hypothetical protein
MAKADNPEFEQFDKVMRGLLAVPNSELQEDLFDMLGAQFSKKGLLCKV